MGVIFEHFGRVVVKAQGIARVVRNDVLPVSDTVRAHRKRGDKVRKSFVSNARLTEVDHSSWDTSLDQVHLSQ
jgi:hypothetical protein